MLGKLYFRDTNALAVQVDCQLFEYADNHNPEARWRVLYTPVDQRIRDFSVKRDQPFVLKLEDGREAEAIVQWESTAPDGKTIGLLRILGDLR